MFKPNLYLFLVAFLCQAITHAQENAKVDDNFHLYILIGQSNMAGRGELTDDFKRLTDQNVYMLNKEGKWEIASHPLHFDKPAVAGVGPGLSFGMAMANAKPGIKIGLIPCAVGGTPIEKWREGAYDANTQTHPYDDAILRIKIAKQYGVIKGILWHQGEANSSEKNSVNYIKKLEELMANVRKEAGDKNIPIVIGELGQFKTQYQNFNKLLKEATQVIPHAALATSENLTDKGDQTHFDAVSAIEYGKRFAKKMIELQKIN